MQSILQKPAVESAPAANTEPAAAAEAAATPAADTSLANATSPPAGALSRDALRKLIDLDGAKLANYLEGKDANGFRELLPDIVEILKYQTCSVQSAECILYELNRRATKEGLRVNSAEHLSLLRVLDCDVYPIKTRSIAARTCAHIGGDTGVAPMIEKMQVPGLSMTIYYELRDYAEKRGGFKGWLLKRQIERGFKNLPPVGKNNGTEGVPDAEAAPAAEQTKGAS